MRTVKQAKDAYNRAEAASHATYAHIRAGRAATALHSPDDDIPTALHASTPSEPATRDTLDCTGLPRMYEGVFIRMVKPNDDREYLSVPQMALLLGLEVDAVRQRLTDKHIRFFRTRKDSGPYRVYAEDFWQYVLSEYADSPHHIVRVQARWPRAIKRPF